MAQTGYTPISTYYSATASSVPLAANLVAGELALNTNDGKLYYKNSSNVVTLLASSAGASGDVVGPASSTDNALARFDLATGKLIQNSVGLLSDAGILTGLTGVTSSGPVTLSSLTSGRVTYAGTAGLLQDSANLTFNGTTLTANTIGAFTLSGTVAGGGNNINNVIIGASSPLAGAFTTLSATGQIRSSGAISTNSVGLALGYSGANVSLIGAWGSGGATRGILSFYLSDVAGTVGNEYMRLNDTGLAVTGTLSSTLDATIYGLTVGRGGGAVSTNTAVGASALAAVTSSAANAAFGYQALLTTITGDENSAFGYQALKLNTGKDNSAFGIVALATNSSGNYNTALGAYALNANTTASNNTAVGYQAAYANTATETTAVGAYALTGNTSGTNNTGIGYAAGSATTTGTNATYIGNRAGYYANNTGSTAVGALAMQGTGAGTQTGNYNTGIGHYALYAVTTGASNATLGYNSGSLITSGSNNVIIGSYAGSGSPISNTGTGYVVLSDGGANIVAHTKSGQTFALQGGTLSAGTGIAFPATQSASTDANTLDDYEEGTWTPSQGAGLTVVGAFSSSGTYTKIGRQVTVQGFVSGATSIAITSGTVLCGNMPFTSANYGLGTATDNNAQNGISLYPSLTSLYAAGTIGATSIRIPFGFTYFV